MANDKIWDGDLFNRAVESRQLIGYIETVAARPSLREDSHGYVMAVDAPYGQGKSYFLKRFAQEMAQSHPVAFVDAWIDDLEDEPLVALAATLDEALAPLASKSPSLAGKIASFRSKAGAVARLAAVGLMKRGLSLVVMSAAADAIGDVITKPDELTKDLGKHVLEEAGSGLINDAADGMRPLTTASMDERIARFRNGREAIDNLKASLRAIVAHLEEEQTHAPPIVIVIDELDRCRPSYSVKLMEEAKHLFDVPGLVFVLGIHEGQLGHSISATYGPSFDGHAYLRRFFQRRYRLREAELYPLIQSIAKKRHLDLTRLSSPMIQQGSGRAASLEPIRVIALYMSLYGLNARDTFHVADMLEVCLALTGPAHLLVPLLMPLIVAHIRNSDNLPTVVNGGHWRYAHFENGGSANYVEPDRLAATLRDAAWLDDSQLMDRINGLNKNWACTLIAEATFTANPPMEDIDKPRGYHRLLQTVNRFK